jgi:Xaa-Pro aminopeptidase
LNWDAHDSFHAYLHDESPNTNIENAFALVATQRMVKTSAEIDRMRATARLTSEAIVTAGARVAPGVDERGLEAIFEGACKKGGAQRLAFSSIIKSGPNSLWPWRVLASHYNRRNRAMEAGDLVIFDVGCELDGYVSDVGRTLPVSGSFSTEQREILEMVTGIADAIIAAIEPGVTFHELREVAQHAIPPEHRQYMMVGSFYGHHLGLSTGDPSLLDAPLEPGMIFTVEPWYYNHDIEIAVFIEEEILVTPDGAEILTGMLPRTPAELEAIVRGR